MVCIRKKIYMKNMGMYVFMFVCMYAYACACLICMFICLYLFVYMYVCVCLNELVCTFSFRMVLWCTSGRICM